MYRISQVGSVTLTLHVLLRMYYIGLRYTGLTGYQSAISLHFQSCSQCC